MIRNTLFVLAALIFGFAMGLWFASYRSRRMSCNNTMTDIHGNGSWTRQGAAWCIALSFLAFFACAFWPTLITIADKFITVIMTYAGVTLSAGKVSEEGGSAVTKWLDKLKGGSDAAQS